MPCPHANPECECVRSEDDIGKDEYAAYVALKLKDPPYPGAYGDWYPIETRLYRTILKYYDDFWAEKAAYETLRKERWLINPFYFGQYSVQQLDRYRTALRDFRAGRPDTWACKFNAKPF